ncbi:hypothetical protein GJ496_006714 [Pomphorhynchus laevis]|nr:hypothetical protein GJ496_006714 [Pomphorhynchus laevis]
MIGEIRDEETARNVFRAALTGHTVISTMHTKNKYGVIERLLDFGFLQSEIESVLIGVSNQRLILDSVGDSKSFYDYALGEDITKLIASKGIGDTIENKIEKLRIQVLLLLTIPNITKHKQTVDEKGCESYADMVQTQVTAYELAEGKLPTSIGVLESAGYIPSSTCSDGTTLKLDGDIRYNMKTKKKQEISPSEKKNLNNAFFMPTVMAYIIIFLTFLLWQVNEVLGYQNLASDYMDSANREMALIKLEEKIENDALINKALPCIPSIYPGIPIKYEDYSINSTVYCVRMPQNDYPVPKNRMIKTMVNMILSTPQELNHLMYKAFQGSLLALYSAERLFCWIEEYKDKLPSELSLGTAQRFNIALKLFNSNADVIADEPFNGLDLIQSESIQQYIKKLKNKDRTIIISSHDILSLKEICDEIVFLKDGILTVVDNNNSLEVNRIHELLK